MSPKLLYVQLDFRMEPYIAHLKTSILADLNRFAFKRSSSTWFSVYAAAFVNLVTLKNDTWRLETWKDKLRAKVNLHLVSHFFAPKPRSIVLTSTRYPVELTSLASPERLWFLYVRHTFMLVARGFFRFEQMRLVKHLPIRAA